MILSELKYQAVVVSPRKYNTYSQSLLVAYHLTGGTWTPGPSSSPMMTSSSHTGNVNMFSVDTGKLEHSLDSKSKFTLTLSLAASRDGKHLATGAIDGIINVFDLGTKKLVHTLEGHAMPIRSLCFSPDSTKLLTGSDDGHLKLYDISHATLLGTMSGKHCQSWSVPWRSKNFIFRSYVLGYFSSLLSK